jgi:hypothetical protein
VPARGANQESDRRRGLSGRLGNNAEEAVKTQKLQKVDARWRDALRREQLHRDKAEKLKRM